MNNLKPFNLERVLAGDKVVTRDGEEVTELHFFKTISHNYPITAIIREEGYTFTVNGESFVNKITDEDLFMAPTKKTGWINIYNNMRGNSYCSIYPKKEEAIKHCDWKHLADCIQIEWEE